MRVVKPLGALLASALLLPALAPVVAADTIENVVELTAEHAVDFTVDETAVVVDSILAGTEGQVDTILNATQGTLRVTENVTALTLEGIDTVVDAIGGVSWWPPGPGTAPQRALAHVPAIQAKTLSTANAAATLGVNGTSDLSRAGTAPGIVFATGTHSNTMDFTGDVTYMTPRTLSDAEADALHYAGLVVDPTLVAAEAVVDAALVVAEPVVKPVRDVVFGVTPPCSAKTGGGLKSPVSGLPSQNVPLVTTPRQEVPTVILPDNGGSLGGGSVGGESYGGFTLGGDCIGKGFLDAENVSSPVSGSSGTGNPGSISSISDPPKCSTGQYGFTAQLKTGKRSGCYYFNQLGVVNTKGTQVDTVKLEYSPTQSNVATLTVSNGINDMTGFKIVLGGALEYRADGTLPATVQMRLDGVQYDLFKGADSSPNLQIRYAATSKSWVQFKLTPNPSTPSTWFQVHMGTFKVDSRNSASTYAPASFTLDLTVTKESDKRGKVNLKYTGSETPLVVTWPTSGSPFDIKIKNLPAKAELDLDITAETARTRVTGSLNLFGKQIESVWLPVPGIQNARLYHVPSIKRIVYEDVVMGSASACDSRPLSEISASVTGQRQFCVTLDLRSNEAGHDQYSGLRLDNDAIQLSLPKAEMQFTFGPANAVYYSQTCNNFSPCTTGANLDMRKSSLLPELEELRINDLRSLTLIPGATLGSGVLAGNGCNFSSLKDSMSGKNDFLLEAEFGTASWFSLHLKDKNTKATMATLTISAIKKFSTANTKIDVQWHPSGGKANGWLNMGNSCKGLEVSLNSDGMKRITFWNGGNGNGDAARALVHVGNVNQLVGGNFKIKGTVKDWGLWCMSPGQFTADVYIKRHNSNEYKAGFWIGLNSGCGYKKDERIKAQSASSGDNFRYWAYRIAWWEGCCPTWKYIIVYSLDPNDWT